MISEQIEEELRRYYITRLTESLKVEFNGLTVPRMEVDEEFAERILKLVRNYE